MWLADLLGCSPPSAAAEAQRLAALVVELMPDDPEAGGLNALVLLQQSRAVARTGVGGTLVPLEEQDRGRWDRQLIAAGLAELRRTARRDRRGRRLIQPAGSAGACSIGKRMGLNRYWSRPEPG
ncbi:DUF6596 domain-containing protein [Nocardia sp. NPDC059246]|uniref:DUF6596 domain-containing protein n=1 Tax=unclassified Nocardia TaxID=2637762 RepID=UPI0036BE913A